MSESGTSEALKLLIAQRNRLDRAIATLQGGSEEAPRRGRPPGSKNVVKTEPKKRGRRSPMSPDEKKAASERMKKYWAARRKVKKKA